MCHVWASLSDVFYWRASAIIIPEVFFSSWINQKLQKSIFHSCLESRHLAVIVQNWGRRRLWGFNIQCVSFDLISLFSVQNPDLPYAWSPPERLSA